MEGVGLLPSMGVFIKEESSQLLLKSLAVSCKGGRVTFLFFDNRFIFLHVFVLSAVQAA